MAEINQETLPFKATFEHSPTIGKLTEALAKASLEFSEVHKETSNPFFKSTYADLAALIKATRTALAKHGLVILQLPSVNGRAAVTTMLSHVSSEWVRTTLELPSAKNDAQGLGSAITYARRYGYQAILNIAGEEDDDGNMATGKGYERGGSSTSSTKGPINEVQQRAFMSAADKGGRTQKQIADYLTTLGIKELEHLSKADFDTAIKWALNVKPGNMADLENSVKAVRQKLKTAPEEETFLTDDDLYSRCAKHGDYKGADCPKCV